MTAIAQMQVRFDPGEDRLVLRVRNDNGDEFRFWLTRRYVLLAWPLLAERLKSAPATIASNPDARRELASFEHQTALQAADFDTPFEDEPHSVPLGETPALLARFTLRDKGEAGVTLSLHPEQGQGIDLGLSRPLLHSFCKLVADAARLAEWELPAALPEPSPTPPVGVAH